MRLKEDDQTEARRVRAIPKPQDEKERNTQRMSKIPKREDHKIDMGTYDDMYSMPPPPPPLLPPPSPPSTTPPPPPPPPPPPVEVIVEPKLPAQVTTVKPSTKRLPTFAKSFTIASLQQYTNSFSQENLIGGGMLGTVYRAQLPDGKVQFSTIN